MRLCLLLAAALWTAGVQAGAPRQSILDNMKDPAAWRAVASDQVKAALRSERDGSLCLDYDFGSVSGYAVMRRELPMQWPERFDLRVHLKGSGGANDLQVKLVDASGDNVWWATRPNYVAPAVLSEHRIRRRHIGFAWGPTADRSLKSTQFVEFVVAAGRDGGRGSLCVARLDLAERAAEPATWPAPKVVASVRGVDIDLGLAREFNGLALRWPHAGAGLDYDVLAGDDARRWRMLRRVRGSDGGLDALFLPESEARYLRVRYLRGTARPKLELRSATEWPNFNAVLASLGADAPRGDLPRAFVGEQNYWTLVGVDGGSARSGLMSEDGALEIGRGGYSIEPVVLLDDGSQVTWAQATAAHRLRDGYLPIPSVRWQHAAFTLDIEAAADGPQASPALMTRYLLRNTSTRTQTYTLLLATRPWQVNPPQQFLSTQGGASPIRSLRAHDKTLIVNEGPALRFDPAPDRITALRLDGGASLAALRAAPVLTTLHDAQSHASAGLHFHITLAPGASRTVGLMAPLGTAAAGEVTALAKRYDAVADQWRGRLNRTTLKLPPDAQLIVDTLRTSLAQMLMSRDGPALRPGTRSYARSWVRDGAMMVAGLVQLGEYGPAREFTDWFAGHIFASGKVPCCVDQRGADPVVENDSHGQYLYAVAEVWRHTRDRAFLERHWPHVLRVTAWMQAQRQSERGDANRTPERAHLFGLMPPSISHEGYADKPAYSYWDNFWTLRGFKDAVLMARALGHDTQALTWSAARDEFERELAQSIVATARHYGMSEIAGAADRGDFDATATTMALNPAQAEISLDLLQATFERYWQEMNARTEGRRKWSDYTPYELRTVGALTRLGQAPRAHAMLGFFFQGQHPKGWNQWAEVVVADPRKPHFLGDMPHAWVSSDYVRSVLDLFAYERESDSALIVGAGWKAQWLQHDVLELRGLSTPYGLFELTLERNPRGWTLKTPRALPGLRGGVRLVWPVGLPQPRALHGLIELAWSANGELALPPGATAVELLTESAMAP